MKNTKKNKGNNLVNELRKKLDKYNNDDNKLIEKLDEERLRKFNMFYVLNLQSYEIRHSSFLAWLMNGSAPHELHNEILRRIFDVCYPQNTIDWEKNISVKTELSIRNEDKEKDINSDDKKSRKSSRRIDIFLENSQFTCTIENKYGSKLHNKQCPDYYKWVTANYKKTDNKFILLDRPIVKPKELDNDPNYDPVFVYCSYKTILDILIELLPTMKADTDIYYSIKAYIDVLDNYYNPKKEISDLLKKVETEDRYYFVANQYNITNKYKNLFTASQISFIDDLVAYHDKMKIEDDDVVCDIMKEVLNDEVELKDDYGHNKSKSKRYGYALRLLKEDCKTALSVDYPVAEGKRIVCGLGRCSSAKAKNLILFLANNPKALEELVKNNWKVSWSLQLRSTANQTSWKGITLDTICAKKVIPTKELAELNRSLLKADDNEKKAELKKVIDYLSDEDFQKLEKEHVKGNLKKSASRDEVIDMMDVSNLGHINFKLDVIYKIPDGMTKKELGDIYPEKTQEIMKKFNPNIDLTKYFKEEYIN